MAADWFAVLAGGITGVRTVDERRVSTPPMPPPPTILWLSTVPELPALDGAAATAERLVLLLHYGIDWDRSWVARHRSRYWDWLLPNRIKDSTYRTDTLDQWWSTVAADLVSTPRTPAERIDLAALLREPGPPVLEFLRDSTEALILRTRIVADRRRNLREKATP
mgnify:CR=1 FL=1